MLKKIKKIATKDLRWKIISLIIAFFLWLFVIERTDPEFRSDFRNTLSVENVDYLKNKNIKILNEESINNANVIVTIVGRNSLVNDLRNNFHDFKSSINLEDIDTDDFVVNQPIDLPITHAFPDRQLTNNLNIVSYRPNTITIYLDNIIEKDFNITLNEVKNINKNFITDVPEITPSSVNITGGSTILENIKSVNINLDLNDQTRTINKNVPISVIDNNNEDITSELDLSFNEVNIILPIYESRLIPIEKPTLMGSLAEGFSISRVTFSPESINVIGDSSSLDNFTSITLDTIDISNESETFSTIINIERQITDRGFAIRQNTPTEVTVNIETVTSLTKDIFIPISKIENIGEETNYSIISDDIKLTVEGAEDEINNLKLDDILLTIDLSEYYGGLTSVDVTVKNLPESIKLINSPSIDVLIDGELKPPEINTDIQEISEPLETSDTYNYDAIDGNYDNESLTSDNDEKVNEYNIYEINDDISNPN